MNPNFTSHDLVKRLDQGSSDQWRTTVIASLITLLLHAILFLALPKELLLKQSVADAADNKAIELQLEQPDPEKLRYVETNPEAPENEPDRSDYYSFRSQQAADENPNASPDDMPTVEGDEASLKIIQGSTDQPEPAFPEGGLYTLSKESVKSQDDSSSKPAPASRPILPAPDFIQQKPKVEEGPGSSLKISGSGKQVANEYADIDTQLQFDRVNPENSPDQDSGRVNDSAAEGKPLPRKRLTLAPELVYGPLMRSKSSASRRGALSIDATFSQFGEYEQQFYAAVQAGWYQEINFFQPIDTSARVEVEFRIHSNGTIDEVKILNSNASEIATLICQSALTKRSPFRPWTAEMIEVFGQERVMKVLFSYR